MSRSLGALVVLLTLSSAPLAAADSDDQVKMPDLHGLTLPQAKDALKRAGITDAVRLGDVRDSHAEHCQDDTFASCKGHGIVCAQEPDPGGHLRRSFAIWVTVSP